MNIFTSGLKVQDPETYAKIWATKNPYFVQKNPAPPSIDHIMCQIETMELTLIRLRSDIARIKSSVNKIAGEDIYKLPETSPLPGINMWDVIPSSPQLVKQTV